MVATLLGQNCAGLSLIWYRIQVVDFCTTETGILQLGMPKKGRNNPSAPPVIRVRLAVYIFFRAISLQNNRPPVRQKTTTTDNFEQA